MLGKLKNLNLKLIKQIFKFGIVGFAATIVEWFIFYICTNIFMIHYLISTIIAFCFSVVFNYVFSIRWVFNVTKKTKALFSAFVLLSIVGLGLNELIMFLFVEKLHINTMLSKILATLIVMIYNFVTRKIFIEDRN